jgi:hypothetical protein
MKRVTGIVGILVEARDPGALGALYARAISAATCRMAAAGVRRRDGRRSKNM